jgi:anti-sigma regulatory factor (Ser/Thr protein kinase)
MNGRTSAHPCGATTSGIGDAGNGTDARREIAARLREQDGTRVPVPPSHHGHSLERWPRRNAITFGALEGAVPSARAHLRQLLWEWGQVELSQDAAIVASELVTNAVHASAELRPAVAPVLVWAGSDGDRILVAVADASPRSPVRLNLEPDADGGRGLSLVEAFSSRWGWHSTNMPGLAKVVWAEWHLPANARQLPETYRPSRRHAI